MNTTKLHILQASLAVLLVALVGAALFGANGIVRADTVSALSPLSAQAPIYTDSLAPSWQDWSWDTTRNLANISPVQSGVASIAITFTKPWAGFYIHSDSGLSTSGYTHLEFYIHGGLSSQQLNVVANKNSTKAFLVTAKPSTWTKVSIPLSSLGSPAALTDLYLQDALGQAQPKFYVDSISLVNLTAPAATPTAPAPSLATATKIVTFLPTVYVSPTTDPRGLPTPTPTAQPPASGGPVIYSDGLATGWQDWTWGTTHNLGNTSPVQSGSASISVQYTSAWAGLYLRNDAGLSTAGYDQIVFWAHGGSSGGQQVRVVANMDTNNGFLFTPVANTWTQVVVPLSKFNWPTTINDLVFQEGAGATPPVFYIDNIKMGSSGQPTPTPTTPPPPGNYNLTVNAGAGVHAISPDIYGMNFADPALAKELRLPVDRYGGNATTRYNWQNDTSNRAGDWFFENIPNDNSNPGALPNGSSSDQFVSKDQGSGTSTLMTVPMIGWTPKDRTTRCAFAVSKYGAQQYTDPYRPDCGNGMRSDGSKITNNDPTDTSVQIGPSFVQGFVQHLTSVFGTAAAGGVKYYDLDNEPALWNSNHRDVHPNPVSYDELRDRTYQYGAAVKAADPSAKTLGPAEWGWTNYFYSALDAASGNWSNPPDRIAHGNVPLTDWYLQQMKAYEQAHGVRILDYLDLHYYPQSGVALTGAGDSNLQAKRLRSTRSLWDASYTDESWINEPVRLIPRMRDWVNNNYPGTKIAISEYNFGGLESINGAVTEADILGIFGREGLDLATIWDPPTTGQPGAYAFRMYRNYDGTGKGFGETGVTAASTDQNTLSIYAATRASDGALTIMVINKNSNTQNGAIGISSFNVSTSAQVYRYSSANLNAIVRQADVAVNGSSISTSFPGSSITLIVVPHR